jgi:hypothetical protein
MCWKICKKGTVGKKSCRLKDNIKRKGTSAGIKQLRREVVVDLM